MSNPFLGEIRMFAGNFAPKGWALCNGQLMSIAQNTALFSILGTTYGGNGQTTFGLPNMQSRAPIHAGQGTGLSNYVLGEMIGVENVGLTINNLPTHTHSLLGSSGGGTQASPSGGVPAVKSTGTSMNYAGSANVTMGGAIGTTGGNLPISIIQPVLCVNFIIALQGIFPSRS